MAISDTIISA